MKQRISKWELEELLKAGINPYGYIKHRQKEDYDEFKHLIWKWHEEGKRRGKGKVAIDLDHLSCLDVSGETYPIKDLLKELGFRWNSVEKSWYREVSTVREAIRLAQKIQEALS